MRDLNDAREVLTVETRRRFDLDYVPQPCNPAAVSEEQVAEARAAMRRVYAGLYGDQLTEGSDDDESTIGPDSGRRDDGCGPVAHSA